jgi:hypothetical protein
LVISNGTTSLTIPAAATKFAFPETIASGSTFEVAVEGDPDGALCAVSGTSGTGVATSANSNSIVVECLSDGPNGEATAAQEELLTVEPAAPNPSAAYTTETVGAANTDSIDTAQVFFARPAQRVVTPVNPGTISGTIKFQRVFQGNSQTCAAGTGGCGLDFTKIVTLPARYIQVDLVDATTNVQLSTTYTDASGNYSMQVSAGSNVLVRAYSSVQKSISGTNCTSCSYNFTVVDNTSSNALYVLQYPTTIQNVVANTTTTANLQADLGYDTTGVVTGTRASAPFTILDDLTNFTEALVGSSVSVAQYIKPLTVNWSVNNVPSDGDKTKGFISTSNYDGTALNILGKADTDTDEFDVGVMGHEWGHWIQTIMSNSDNPGGSHGTGEIKDFSLAYGEGWGYGFSAGLITASGQYGLGSAPYTAGYTSITGYNYDTSGVKSATGSSTVMSTVPSTAKGAFDEAAVGYAMYQTMVQANGIGPFINTVIDLRSRSYAATVIGFAASYYAVNNTNSSALVTGMLQALSNINVNFTGNTGPDGFGANYTDARLTSSATAQQLATVAKTGATTALQDDYSKLYVPITVGGTVNVSFSNQFNYGTESSNGLGMTRRLQATGLSTGVIYKVCFQGSGVDANQLYFLVRGAKNYVYLSALGGVKNCTNFMLDAGDTSSSVAIALKLSNSVITTNYAPVTVTLTAL